jgi:hypothetical protein
MNSAVVYTINERDNNILISNKSPTNKKDMFSFNEYSLKQNFFDPSKHSPPNDFMLKLQLRMSVYNSFSKDGNLINE